MMMRGFSFFSFFVLSSPPPRLLVVVLLLFVSSLLTTTTTAASFSITSSSASSSLISHHHRTASKLHHHFQPTPMPTQINQHKTTMTTTTRQNLMTFMTATTVAAGDSSSSSSHPTTITTMTSTSTTTSSSSTEQQPQQQKPLGPLASTLVRLGMCLYVALLCVALPLTLLPQALLYKMKWIDKRTLEVWAWRTGEFCCTWLLRLIPFCHVECCQSGAAATTTQPGEGDEDTDQKQSSSSCIWVCNHTSMLDVFILLASDATLRGKRRHSSRKSQQRKGTFGSGMIRSFFSRLSSSSSTSSSTPSSTTNSNNNLHRPIKVVYWKQLEDNFVTKLLFRQAGFLPVDMAANGHGQANEYDKRTFKTLLQQCKQALNGKNGSGNNGGDGNNGGNGGIDDASFDIGILPEGQLNPHTERGVLPVFSGAYTLAKLCHKPIGMMALHGIDQLWHPTKGMICTQRHVRVRCYSEHVRFYHSSEEFVQTFSRVVGHFGQTGRDVVDWNEWMNGSHWKEQLQQQQQQLQETTVKHQETETTTAVKHQETETTTAVKHQETETTTPVKHQETETTTAVKQVDALHTLVSPNNSNISNNNIVTTPPPPTVPTTIVENTTTITPTTTTTTSSSAEMV